ncbi:putative N-acetyltransferase family protein [Tothia fuscella]|uniref:N-acetyltransferase family protein n=1 Tax=Tothia fuscella TaxID=1048955 RepID=A0A9P4NQ41_9PEZI|nr:putative N-acetyltransferase family protein [Tothia fuscella]
MSFNGVVYNESQIDFYLKRIKFPDIPLPTPDNVTTGYGLEYLRRLQKYQQQACPFENLNLHYARDVIKTLAPEDLYQKFVIRKWGGTCTENNTFFGNVLRSLGYKVRPCGARVHQGHAGNGDGGYVGWNHCINLVTIDGQKYLVDVGMGPTSPSQPLLLQENNIQTGIGASKCRLRWDTIPQYTDPDSKLWIYEQDNDGKSDFLPTYCSPELEFLPQDYEIIKMGTTFNRRSFFTWKIICVRTTLNEQEDVEGVLILVDKSLKRRIMGKTEVLATFENESQRVNALKGWFGIEMTEDEKVGIRGMVTYLGE